MEEKYWRAFTDMSRLVRPVHRETEWLPVQHRALAIDAPGAIDDWPDVEYQYDDNGPPVSLDSVRTHRGIVLWSERMRELVENLLLPEEEVQWLPVTVTAEDVSLPAYFAPNPLYGPEALHGQTTRMPGDGPLAGGVVKGVFARDRINSRAMLKYPYGSEPVVAERVRRAVEEAGFTGFDFAPVPVR